MADAYERPLSGLSPHLSVSNAAAAIDFYKNAFGAVELTRRLAPDERRIMHGAATRKLIVGVPFSDNGDLRDVFIFRLKSVDEVRAMVDADPAVKAGRLVVELHPWFAAAGLRVDALK